jgi:hypothetical protein
MPAADYPGTAILVHEKEFRLAIEQRLFRRARTAVEDVLMHTVANLGAVPSEASSVRLLSDERRIESSGS